MTGGLERILTLSFGTGGTEINHLGNGWSGEEPGSRWMVGQASELWLEHPGAEHDLILDIDVGVMHGPPGGEAQRLVLGVRNMGAAQIGVAHGGALGFHIPKALIAAPGPVRLLFVHPDFRRPVDVGAGADDRQLAFSVQSLRLFRVLPRPAPPRPAPLPRDQLVTRFESLGDNCEFGLVQRKMGAEPLGLLRFSYIELPLLLRGLRRGFEGLGDPDTTEVAADPNGEFVVRELVYGMTYHTFQYDHGYEYRNGTATAGRAAGFPPAQVDGGHRRRREDLRAEADPAAAARGSVAGLRGAERARPELVAVDGAVRRDASARDGGSSVAGPVARLHRSLRAQRKRARSVARRVARGLRGGVAGGGRLARPRRRVMPRPDLLGAELHTRR